MIGKRLTLENIDKCHEIQIWLNQFLPTDLLAAKSLLCRLRFISRDDYSRWVLSKLANYSNLDSVAVYAVRKFRKSAQCLWKKNGAMQPRPARTQGSEDLVSSVLSLANRQYGNCFFDHPSLNDIEDKKVRNIILIDDSIGSGKRIADFIRLMMNRKKFLSWWSGGFIRLHVLAYARTYQAEHLIFKRVPGSNHGIRKIRLTQKLKFDSEFIYDARDIDNRWGQAANAILKICNSYKQIGKDRRRGFGNVMGNIIFYHSVPNNIPGLLYLRTPKWTPLLPNRSLPEWIISLLDENYDNYTDLKLGGERLIISYDIVRLLTLIKSGLRTRASLARRMDCDELIIKDLIEQSIKLGFISNRIRLLKSGYDIFYLHQHKKNVIKPDYSLYLPETWRAGQ